MKKNSFTVWLMASIVLFAFVGAFAKIMTSLNHNEHMYHAASVFVSQNKVLYKDFAYVQMPYLPLLYGNLYKLLGVDSYYLLIGKLFSFLFLSISAAILFLIARRVLNDIVPALGIVALFLLNTTILNPATEISNYIMPLAFSLAGFYLFSGVTNQTKPFVPALAGFFVALAIGTKLTYATTVIPFVVVSLLYPLMNGQSVITLRRSIVYILLPFVVGAAIGFIPLLSYMSDFEAFMFNNLGYHNTNTQWREMTGYTRPMSMYAKIFYAHSVLLQPDNLILLLGIVLGLGLSFDSFRAAKTAIKQMPVGAFLAILLFFIAIPTALAPTPSFFQYYAIPVSFLFLVLVYVWASRSADTSTLNRRWLLILVLAALVYNGPSLLNSAYRLTQRDAWAGLRVHDVSMNVRKAIIDNGVDANRKIATLSPLYAIEANLPIYPQFSTGPFLYRISDLLTPKQRNHFVGTSQKSVKELLNAEPPAAILVGLEGNLDEPLIEYGKSNNYKEVAVPGLGGKLYVRPEAVTDVDLPMRSNGF